MGHGIGRKKAASFEAVPSVLKNGYVIDYQINWKDRKRNTAVIAAPITMSDGEYFMGIVVQQDEEGYEFYVHEVMQQKIEALPFKTGTGKKAGTPSGNASIMSLLHELVEVKRESENVQESKSKSSRVIDSDYMNAVEAGDMETAQQTQRNQGAWTEEKTPPGMAVW